MIPTPEMIEAAKLAYATNYHPSNWDFPMRKAITAAIALLPGQPTAVMWVDSTGCENVTTDVERGKAAAAAWGYTFIPLYVSPHSSPEPTIEPINLDEEWETFNRRRFLHGHRETMRESFEAIFRDAFPAAVSLLESTADSRIAELEQQIANIKASRDLQVTIAADEEERARKAEAERETYEEILRVVCGHLELPQSESGPADDLSLYDRALEQADVMYRQTEAERVEHMNARYKAESEVFRLEANIKRLTSNPADHRYWEGRWRDSEAKLAEAVKVIEQPFCVMFLDGRNEHGSHVLPSYPRSFEPVGDDIDDQAEAILVEAERLGFPIGEHVWAEFVDVPDQIGDEGRIEFSGYWEFKGINVEMSRIINASILSKLEGSSHAEA